MQPSPFTLSPPPVVQVRATLKPLPNILHSLWALTANDPEPTRDPTMQTLAVDPWITQQSAKLTPEQRQFNRQIFADFGTLLLQEALLGDDADFANYLDRLATQPTTHAQAFDSSELRRRMVEHLRRLWDDFLAAEWKRHSMMANGMARSSMMMSGMTRSLNETIFSQARWQAINAYDALRFLLQSEPSDAQLAQLAGVRRIELVLSPHLLGFCTRVAAPNTTQKGDTQKGDTQEGDTQKDDTLYVLRKFDPQWMRRDPITRAEILLSLNALADENRLRILELLAEHGEQRAQELIVQLESSQGNVSRHLKQLVGIGYLRERRAGDANKLYARDDAGFQRLIFQLRQLLSRRNAQSVTEQEQIKTRLEEVRAQVSPLLQSFVDTQGRINRWSSKLKDQQAMMEYLIEKFEPERGYSEKEVNELLQQWYLDADFVLIRRSLIDAGLLRRTKDGSRYWRA